MKIQVNAPTYKVEKALHDYSQLYRNEDFSVDIIGDKKEGTFIYLHSDEDQEEVMNAMSDNGMFPNVIKEGYNMQHIKLFEDFDQKDFDQANKTIHPVEKQWHYPIVTKYGFDPITKSAVGFVRQYEYQNSDGYKIIVNTGASADYWNDPQTKAGGFWASLEPHLKKISGEKIQLK